MTPSERQTCIEEIRVFPALLEQAVVGLDDVQLDTSYREGGWTVRQVAHHVADSHVNAYARMRMMLTEEHPTLKPYDHDAWAVLADYSMSLDSTIDLLRGLHERWAVFLESIPEDDWGRAAYHPENGEVTLESLLQSFADHGTHHLAQIERAKAMSGEQ